jgi:hypothetical protein
MIEKKKFICHNFKGMIRQIKDKINANITF